MPRKKPNVERIQFRADDEMNARLDALVSDYATQGISLSRSQAARLVLRTALGEPAQLAAADEAIKSFWGMYANVQRKLLLIIQEKLPYVIEQAVE